MAVRRKRETEHTGFVSLKACLATFLLAFHIIVSCVYYFLIVEPAVVDVIKGPAVVEVIIKGPQNSSSPESKNDLGPRTSYRREAAIVLEPISPDSHDVSNDPEGLTQTKHRRPNILFILSDDHSAEAVGFRPHGRLSRVAGTTNLDRLAREGAVIEDFFATLSLCSPSRASILTGLYAHTHGVTQLNGKIASEVERRTYVDILRKEGYETGQRKKS